MFSCDVCKKEFKRKDNMLRHHRTQHEGLSLNDNEDSDVSDSDGSEMDTESEDGEETIDPWIDMIDYSFDTLQREYESIASRLLKDSDISDKEARAEAFKELLPKYRKLIMNKYLSKVLWFDSIRKDPVHLAIKETAKRLKEEDDFESEESWKYAVSKRKYLFDKLIKQYNPPELN